MLLRFRDWPLNFKLLVSPILIVGFFCLFAYLSYDAIFQKQQEQKAWNDALLQRERSYAQVRANLAEADLSLFRLLLMRKNTRVSDLDKWQEQQHRHIEGVLHRLHLLEQHIRDPFQSPYILSQERPLLLDVQKAGMAYVSEAQQIIGLALSPTPVPDQLYDDLAAQFISLNAAISAWDVFRNAAANQQEREMTAEYMQSLWQFLEAAIVILCSALIFTVWIGRSISRPVQKVAEVLHHLAHGEQTAPVAVTDRKDEVGVMMDAIVRLQKQLATVSAEAADYRQQQEETQKALQAELKKLAASEQRLLDIAESTSDWFWETDKEDRITMVSQRFFDVTKLKPDQIIGVTRLDYARSARSQEEANRWVEYARLKAQHKPFRNLDYRILSGDGRDIHVRSSGVPYFDVNGTFLGYRGASSDVSALMQAREELEASRNYLLGLTSHLFEGVLLVAVDGAILFANPSAHRLLEVKNGTLQGQHIDSVMCVITQGVDTRYLRGPIHRALAVRDTVVDENGQFRILPSGKKISVAYACAATKEDLGTPAVVVSFRSIEALKDAQQEALQASRLASVGQLAAGIAHEINTPIQYVGDNIRFFTKSFADLQSMINAILDAVKKEGVDPSVRDAVLEAIDEADAEYLMEELPEAAQQSLDGVQHVTKIVRSMKEFSHPGEGASKVMTDLNRAIESTLTVTTNEWKHTAVIEKDLDPDLPPVLCLPAEINQVLLNILVNASHALEGRKEKGVIRITSRKDGDEVEIIIADNGPGVPQDLREHIFDPFFTTKSVGKGTGQGLAISMDVIVNKHDGRLTVGDAAGGGAEFVVRLPINSAPEQGEESR